MTDPLKLARKVSKIDPEMKITAAANPIFLIQDLMRQRKLLADEVIRLSKEAK